MGGFGDFLLGATEGGIQGVDDRIVEDQKIDRLKSLEEYRLERKAHWDAITRDAMFAEDNDPARIAIKGDTANTEAIQAANRLLLPEVKRARTVLDAEKVALSGATTKAEEQAKVEVELSSFEKKTAAELEALSAKLSGIKDVFADNNIPATLGNISAAVSGVFDIELETAKSRALLKGATSKQQVAERANSLGFAAANYAMASMEIIDRYSAFIPEGTLTHKGAKTTIRQDIRSNKLAFLASTKIADNQANSEQHYLALMTNLSQAIKFMDSKDEGYAKLVALDNALNQGAKELQDLGRLINEHGEIPYVDVNAAATRINDYIESGGTLPFAMYNIPGLLEGLAQAAGDGERGVLNTQQGVKRAPPPSVEPPVQQAPPAQAPAPILATPPAQQATPPAPTAAIGTDPVAAKKQAIAEKIVARNLSEGDMLAAVEFMVSQNNQDNGGIIPNEQTASSIDEVLALIREMQQRNR